MPEAPPRRLIGLMSGTSLDGVDGVLVELPEVDGTVTPRIHATAHAAFSPAFAEELLALNVSGPDELHRAALAGNRLAHEYAAVVERLLRAAAVAAREVAAIGAHGQTVRHRPGEFDGIGFTIQLDPGALLAELTSIDVVSNFRVRDLAAGGQGAPLVPGFHQALVRGRGATPVNAVLNVGGIANLSLVGPGDRVTGFDCGPGNLLMDLWVREHLGRSFDDRGAWAATGRVDRRLLEVLMDTPFLHMAPPKSTGRDLFNRVWLDDRLDRAAASGSIVAAQRAAHAADVQATLCEFTARCAADALQTAAGASGGVGVLWVCGGGALNQHLMDRLASRLPTVEVRSTADLGLDPTWVEACAFAWLAGRHLDGLPASLPSVTGARGPRVLGVRHVA